MPTEKGVKAAVQNPASDVGSSTDAADDLPPSYSLGGMAYLGYRLAVTAKLFDRKFVRILQEHSTLTLPQWRCIAQLGLKQPGTVRSLAEGAVVDRAEASRALAQLVTQGLVQRLENEGDHRSPNFVLTKQGRQIFEKVRKPVKVFIASLAEQVTPEDMQAADRVLWTMWKGCLD